MNGNEMHSSPSRVSVREKGTILKGRVLQCRIENKKEQKRPFCNNFTVLYHYFYAITFHFWVTIFRLFLSVRQPSECPPPKALPNHSFYPFNFLFAGRPLDTRRRRGRERPSGKRPLLGASSTQNHDGLSRPRPRRRPSPNCHRISW